MSETDALRNTTDYSFDDRERLVTTTYPDPDGTGSLGRPAVSRTLDGRGGTG